MQRSSIPDLNHLQHVNMPDRFRDSQTVDRKHIAKTEFDALVDHISLKEKTYETSDGGKAWEMDIHIRNRCTKYLNNCRNTAYYRQLHERVANGDELLDHELYYYVVTIDDVKNIPINILRMADARWGNSAFGTNIHALWVLREWQGTRGHYSTTIRDFLKVDAINTLQKCGHGNSFINLSGFNFAYLNLTCFRFKFCDLTGADFSRSNITNTAISYCVADQAILLEIDRYPSHGTDILDITQTSLKHAKIGAIAHFDCRMINCDLTYADFSTAREINVSMFHCRLQHANLKSLRLTNRLDSNEQKGALQGCNIIGTRITNIWLTADDIHDTRILSDKSCVNPRELSIALDKLNEQTEQCRTLHGDSKQVNEHIDTIQQIVSNNIMLELAGQENIKGMLVILNHAISHPFFQPKSQWQQSVNSAYKSMNTLFSTCCRGTSSNTYYASPALRQLEVARDSIVAELGHKYQKAQ